MPNSLDATSLILLLNEYLKSSELPVKNIYTIHDCFAMPMNNVEFVIDNLTKIYTLLYSDSRYLKQLDKGILEVIRYHYGNIQHLKDENKLIIYKNKEEKVYFYPNIRYIIK